MANGIWRRIACGFLYFEGITTAASGIVAFVMPGQLIGSLTSKAPGQGAMELLPQLGTAWIVIGCLVCLLPDVREKTLLRWMLLPLLIGDIGHAAAIHPWEAHDAAPLALSILYFINRSLIVWHAAAFVRRWEAERPESDEHGEEDAC